MPNHFHLLVKQLEKGSMEGFMRSLATRYSMYFNKKYSRVGSLFQSIYKAVMVSDDNYLLHLSRYIHLNPSEYTNDLTSAYSSYADYLEIRKTSWVPTKTILSFFNQAKGDFIKGHNTYKSFVESSNKSSSSVLDNLTLEENE